LYLNIPAKLLNPSETIAVWWTKQSGLPSFGAIKPNPLVTSKNFTLPAIIKTLNICKKMRNSCKIDKIYA
jgi:hypothetical protein